MSRTIVNKEQDKDSFDTKIVCQGIEPIPQIFDSSSMLSYSIDIQLAKILRP